MDVASLTVKVVNEGLDETVKGLGDLGKEAGKTEKASDKLSNSFKKIQDDVKKNTGLSRELKDAVAQLNGAYLDSEGRLHGADGKYLKMTDSMKKAINEVDGLKDALKKQGEEAEKSVRSFEKMRKSVDGFNDSVKGLRNAGLVIGGALAGALYKSVNAAKDFESAMADVAKVVDFDTPDGLTNMREDLLELSKQIPITAEGFAQIAAAAGQSGIAADEIVVFAEAAAKMGTAFDISADQAGQAMAEMRVAFKMSQEEVGGLVDQINYLGDSTPNSAAKILEIVQRIGPLGEIAGVSADQIAALGASITTLAPEVVATGLKNMMLRMTAGASATKMMKAAWHDLGLTSQEVALGMQEDSEAMVNTVLDAIRKLPEEDRASYINTIFGAEAIGTVSQLINNSELLAQNLNAVGDATMYAGSAQREFETRSATTENQMILMGNNINTVWIAIGDAVLPVLNRIIEAVIPVIERMADWAKENPALVQGIIIVTGAISGLLLGITGLGLAFAGAISMATGFQAIGAVLAPVFAGLSLPIMGVVAAIAAVIAIGVALYKNWDTVKEKAGQLGSYLSTEFAGVKESVSSVVDGIKDSFNSIVQTVSPALQAAADVFKGTFDSFVQIAQGVLQLVVNTVKTQFMAIVTTIGAVLQIAFTVLKAGFDLMKNAVMTVMKIIVAIIDGDFKRIPKIMGEGISQGVAIVGNALGKIVNVIKDYGKRMFNLGKDFMQGFINGIKSIGSGVVGAASTMASNAVAAVRRTQDSHSPSKVTKKLGGDFAEGFAKGIKENKKPKSEAQKMAENAIKAVKDTIANLKREIALFGNDDPILAMLWDRQNTNKYGGVSDALFNEAVGLTKRKKELEDNAKAADKLAAANQSVYNSVGAIDRQLYELAAERNPYEMLLWDLENTEKYANAGAEAIELLKTKTKELFEEQERQAAVKKAKEAGDAMSQMLGGLGGEKSPLQRLQDEQDERLRIIQESMIAEGGMKQAHTDALLAIDERYEQDLQKLKLAQYGDGLGLFTRFMGAMLGENKRAKRIMFGIEKGFALATILIENKKALAKAWASAPFPYNLPIIAKTAMQTGAISAALDAVNPKGFKTGGYTGSIGANNIAGVVHGNEYVFDAQSTRAIGVENLERIRRGKNTGEVNITVNNHSGAKVETETDSQGNIIMTIRDEVKRSWSNLQNPNSHESKMLGRNVQAPRRR